MDGSGAKHPISARKSAGLTGSASIPGDKSISHRSIILGALAVGETKVTGLLEGEDVLDTAKAAEAFGAQVTRTGEGQWSIHGVGTGGFLEPNDVINYGNSGTGVRLMMGAMATSPISATFTGDASLRSRPMGRITDPLALFGAAAYGRAGGRLPLTVVGAKTPVNVSYRSPVPSAQVKSAVLLAALNARGESVLEETDPTRDHTERMLKAFGATIETDVSNSLRTIRLMGEPELKPQTIAVPRDPSSAAFPVVAGLITEGSEILIPQIGQNPTRNGLFQTLVEMGADLTLENQRIEGGEPVADIRVRFSSLTGIEVPPERAATMIDEYPILSVAAANATGKTVMRGVKELRVKECDRIDAMARGLEANGVRIEEDEDTLIVHGMGSGGVPGGATVDTRLDHRIAMSFLIAGLASQKPVTLDDARPILTSFPNFLPLMRDLGADFQDA